MTSGSIEHRASALSGRPMLRSAIEASRARKAYWAGVKDAKRQGRPVVAAFGLLPREIWHAMDVPVLFMESLALQISSRNLSGRYCRAANEMGFSSELCALHLSLLGILDPSSREPYVDGALVEPDLIVGSTFACMSETKSFLAWKEKLGKPCHIVDIPLNVAGSPVPERTVQYVAGQLEELVRFLVDHGFSYDPVRLSEAVENSRRTMELWSAIERERQRAPTPIGAVDALHCIGSTLIMLLGTKTCVKLFEDLLCELKGKGGGKDAELLRIYLVGIPPLYQLDLLDYPAKWGGVVVKSDLDFFGGSLMHPGLLDSSRSLHSLALKQLSDIINPCFATKLSDAMDTIRKYRIDAVIGFNKRGCRNLPAALRLIKDGARDAGVPMAIFDLDGIDPTEYNRPQAEAAIGAFLDTLAPPRAAQ